MSEIHRKGLVRNLVYVKITVIKYLMLLRTLVNDQINIEEREMKNVRMTGVGGAMMFAIALIVTACSMNTPASDRGAALTGPSGSQTLYTEAISGVTFNYTITSDWGTGFTAEVKINNNSGKAINGWKLTFSFSGNQVITSGWNGKFTQTGKDVTVVNEGYNQQIPNGGSVSIGFQAKYSGANAKPANFALNGSTDGTTASSVSSQQSSVYSKPLPTDFHLWCLNDRNIAQSDFPKYADRYKITAGPTQTFKVYTGDWNPRNDGTPSCRVEAFDLGKFNPGSTWHQFEATFKVNTAIALDICVAQLKSHATELPQIMVIYKNGSITYQSRGDGNVVLGTGYANKEFTIKMRSNGNQEELYFNGVKKYSGVPYNTAGNAENYFRWGIYMGEKTPGNVTVTITKFSRN